MKKSWKIFFGIWALLFLLFAYWQLNDPDPEWWVPAYLVGAMIAGFATIEIFPFKLLVVLTILYLSAALFFWPSDIFGWLSQEMEQKNLAMKTQQMEINREFFGLLLLSIITFLAFWQGRKLKLKENHQTENE
jgi:hypothetical protein